MTTRSRRSRLSTEKERVIGPILRAELELIVGLAMGVNTDHFGTFSREVER